MNNVLSQTIASVFDLCNFEISNIIIENESSDYCAHQFKLNGLNVVFRQAKITPTKTGQFVTLWKRKNEKSPIEPFESNDDFDLFVINVKCFTSSSKALGFETRLGQFVFPKSILVEKGIVSDKKEGKRAIRVYPIWDKTESKQAQKTQKWQLDYFLEIPIQGKLNIEKAKNLYSIK